MDELALRMRILEMQPAQNALAGVREIILDEMPVQAGFRVAAQVPGFLEEPAFIAKDIGFDQQQARERSSFDDHAGCPCLSRRNRYSP